MTDTPFELVGHYREQADRVRVLALLAVIPAVREALLDVVQQYEDLAENVRKARLDRASMIRSGAAIDYSRAKPSQH
jgi:hypothetical protein